MRGASLRVALLSSVLGQLAPMSAFASASYPAEIQSQLSLSYTPACAICHANGVTGYGTVTTPFGEAMRAVGLVCCSIPSLDGALAALEAENSPYIEYLKEGLNPNDPGAGAAPPPSYGCFSITGQRQGAGAAFLLAAALLFGRRRRPLRPPATEGCGGARPAAGASPSRGRASGW